MLLAAPLSLAAPPPLFADARAWYRHRTFDEGTSTWPDASGHGFAANASSGAGLRIMSG